MSNVGLLMGPVSLRETHLDKRFVGFVAFSGLFDLAPDGYHCA
jgi:hypothetical protein